MSEDGAWISAPDSAQESAHASAPNVALRDPANQVAPLAPVLWAAGALPGVVILLAALIGAIVIARRE